VATKEKEENIGSFYSLSAYFIQPFIWERILSGVHFPYKVHERKNMKARGLQIIIKTLTILKNKRYGWVITMTSAQWAHNVQ
jgi:hypothetical protein